MTTASTSKTHQLFELPRRSTDSAALPGLQESWQV